MKCVAGNHPGNRRCEVCAGYLRSWSLPSSWRFICPSNKPVGFRKLVPILIIFSWAPAIQGDTVVDVSKEWNEHSANPVSSSQQSSSTAKLVQESSAPPACECETLTPQERLEDATYAFTGTVSEAPVTKKGKRTAVFDVNEIFKGSPKPEMKVTEEIAGT